MKQEIDAHAPDDAVVVPDYFLLCVDYEMVNGYAVFSSDNTLSILIQITVILAETKYNRAIY